MKSFAMSSIIAPAYMPYFSGTQHDFKGITNKGQFVGHVLGINSSVFFHIFIFFSVIHIASKVNDSFK